MDAVLPNFTKIDFMQDLCVRNTNKFVNSGISGNTACVSHNKRAVQSRNPLNYDSNPNLLCRHFLGYL